MLSCNAVFNALSPAYRMSFAHHLIGKAGYPANYILSGSLKKYKVLRLSTECCIIRAQCATLGSKRTIKRAAALRNCACGNRIPRKFYLHSAGRATHPPYRNLLFGDSQPHSKQEIQYPNNETPFLEDSFILFANSL